MNCRATSRFSKVLVLAALSSACGGARGNAGLPVATVDASGDTGTRDVALAVDGGVADTSLGEDRFEAVDSTVTDLGFDVAVTDVGVSEACVATGGEDTNAQCTDRVDNDCDGHIDCDDFNCSMSATVTLCRDASVADVPRVDTGCVRSGIETSLAECADHIDNDCDGYTDCADRNCSCVGACGAYLPGCACRGSENTNAACVDRVDNDCNGFVDCSDFGCSRSASVSVCADAGSH